MKSQQFLLEMVPEAEYADKISFPIFCAFGRCSCSNIDGVMAIQNFDISWDLMTSSMMSLMHDSYVHQV